MDRQMGKTSVVDPTITLSFWIAYRSFRSEVQLQTLRAAPKSGPGQIYQRTDQSDSAAMVRVNSDPFFRSRMQERAWFRPLRKTPARSAPSDGVGKRFFHHPVPGVGGMDLERVGSSLLHQ